MSEQEETRVRQADAMAAWRAVFVVVAAVAGLLSLVMAVVLFANDFAIGSLDIANSLELQKAREDFDVRGSDDAYARRLAELDLAARKEYAARRELAHKAKIVLVVSLVFFLMGVNGVVLSRPRLPHPAAAGDAERRQLRHNALGRWAVAGCAAVAVAAGVVAAVRVGPQEAPSRLTPAAVRQIGGRPGATAASMPAPYAPPSAEQIARNWPYFRGPYGSGVCDCPQVPADWNEKQNRNILWKVELPLSGASSPVVWEGKVFLTAADKDVRKVLCYDARSGECLWAEGYTDTGAAKDIKVFQDYVYAAGTPVVDGRCVAAVFANGDVVCFDFDGNELWAANVGDTSKNMYGYSSSLAMDARAVLVQFDGGEEGALLALDVQTGREIWRQDRSDKSWASPVVITAPTGARQVVVAGGPTVSAWEPQTGRIIWWADVLTEDVACSPVLAGRFVIAVSEQAGMFAFRPDCEDDVKDSALAWKIGPHDLEFTSFPDASSPVSDGELIYCFSGTVLVCIDAKTGRTVYEKDVEHSASYASPVIAAGKLYLFAGKKTLIVQTGRQFKLLNTCELNEAFDASPAFVEGRIFIRGRKHLYCIGEKN